MPWLVPAYFERYYKMCPMCARLCGRNVRDDRLGKHVGSAGNVCMGTYCKWSELPSLTAEQIERYKAKVNKASPK